MEDRKTGKNTKKRICMAADVGIALVLTGFLYFDRSSVVKAKVAKTQESLAEEVFRFHVLGNSDSRKDQEVKLKVRDAVIDYMKRDMGEWEDLSGGEDAAKAEATIPTVQKRKSPPATSRTSGTETCCFRKGSMRP